MPFLAPGEKVFSKYMADIQLVVVVNGNKQYVPLTSFSYDWVTEMTAEHYSGQRHAANLTQGNNDCKVTFETGWVTDNPDDAAFWEYLLSLLVNFADQGTSEYFDVELHERVYNDRAGGNSGKGGNIWAAFRQCKLNHHTGAGAQGSLAKRTYEAMCKRPAWGAYGDEASAQ
jgi:hypothetical protein